MNSRQKDMSDVDVLIVGGGAAGLFAANILADKGRRALIVEHMESCGKKLAITGKGRCNVTNNCGETEFMRNLRHNGKFMYSAIHAFPPQKAMEYFENNLSLPLIEERGRRVFPKSQNAADVIDALMKNMSKTSKVLKGRAKSLIVENGEAKGVALEDGRLIKSACVILAAGGLSYPVTGSTGIGYKMAEEAGHNIRDLQPSLVSLVAKGSICSKMMGITLKNVKLTLFENGKRVFSESGEMIFTHFGVSGPLVLTASAYIGDMKKYSYKISIDMKPALTDEQLENRISRDFEEMAGRHAANSLDKLLPSGMRPVLFSLWGVDGEKKINQINKKERKELVKLLKNFSLDIVSRGDFDHAVITSGGVDVREVNPKTMESKIVKGLFFAGEILDVDGYTGGYNLQIAWSTAYAAANFVP